MFVLVLLACDGAEPQRVKTRRYSFRNESLKPGSAMGVRVTERERGTTSFEVLNVIGSEDVYRYVFKELLEGEWRGTETLKGAAAASTYYRDAP
ncbi:MAG TPA: hypothetical protein VEX68_20405 [Bryobacteraceae bacterium]|nr:hypothetical protein [Bryobacteraceae bacterium]